MEKIWLDLYDICNEYKKLKPWEVICSDAMIVVKDEVSQEPAYCMVLGNEGPHFGLNVYLGQKGLVNYLDLVMSEEYGYSEPQVFKSTFSQQGYMINFVDRGDLINEDYSRIKNLGLSYRGKKQWPMFRRYYPGSRPWLFEEESDAILLTRIVTKVIEVVKEVAASKVVIGEEDFIVSADQQINCVLAESILNDENCRPYWVNYHNEFKLHRIKKLKKMPKSLEILQLMLPEETWCEEVNRAVFPLITVIADSMSGYVFSPQLNTEYEKAYTELSDQLSDVILNELKYCPTKIIVNEDFIEDSILDFCEKLGIECEIGETCAADEFVSTMLGMPNHEESFDDNDEDEFVEMLGLQMEKVTDVLIEDMLKHQIIQKVSNDRIVLYAHVLQNILMGMALIQQQSPGQWTESGLKAGLSSGIIDEVIVSEYPNINVKREIDTVLRYYTQLLKIMGEQKEASIIEKALVNYYKK